MDLNKRVALVTGANRGIGAAFIDGLLEAGVGRVYAAVRNPQLLPPRARVVSVALDLSVPGGAEALAQRCPDVEILVNNAGVARGQPLIGASDPAAAEEEMRVNYFGTLAMCRAFAPVLARNGGGAIVNVVSILGRVSLPRVGSYAASKAAAFSLTQGIRAELAPNGTLVVGVLPGFVDTDMTKSLSLPKLAPRAVVEAAIEALRTGAEDVYPGEAAEIARALQSDPKAVERAFAQMARR